MANQVTLQRVTKNQEKTKLPHHIPVMLREAVQYLAPERGGVLVDGTVGLGGHARAIAERLPIKARLIALDQDLEALRIARQRLRDFQDWITFVHGNFRRLDRVLKDLDIKLVDGILLDLGVSTMQLDAPERGFSFSRGSGLDMRMNKNSKCKIQNAELGDPGFCAATIINSWVEEKIRDILFRYGEEPYAGSIARAIVRKRKSQPIITANQLVEVIRQATPPKYRFSRFKTHFATNTFRALRMVVNDELGALTEFLKTVPNFLAPPGRVVIISFHSLEDRLVKNSFHQWAEASRGVILTRKPVRPSDEELKQNPKARSGKLRAFEWLG